MKKNIALVTLGLLLFVSVAAGVLKSQKLNGQLSQAKEVQGQTKTQVQSLKKAQSALRTQYDQLKKEKNNYVISDLTNQVSQFFQAAFNYTANENTYKSRKASAQALATPDVVDYFFGDGQSDATPSFVDSELKNLKVYVENTDQTITTGLVSFTLSSGVDDMVKETTFTYQFTYDSSSKRLTKVNEMKRYLPDTDSESD